MPKGIYIRNKEQLNRLKKQGFQKGSKISEEHKEKIRQKALERLKDGMPEITKRKLSETKKGKHTSISTEFKKGHKHSLKTIEKIRNNSKRLERIAKSIANLPRNMSGKNNPMFGIHRVGSNSPNWIDGRTPIFKRIRHSYRFKQWRMDVFERDNYTCQECSKRGGILHPHHIILFSQILNTLKEWVGIDNLYESALKFEPLWDIDNGQTLCIECHRDIHLKK